MIAVMLTLVGVFVVSTLVGGWLFGLAATAGMATFALVLLAFDRVGKS